MRKTCTTKHVNNSSFSQLFTLKKLLIAIISTGFFTGYVANAQSKSELSILSPTLSSKTLFSGSSNSISYYIFNQGAAVTQFSSTGIYLSKDKTLDLLNDKFLGEFQLLQIDSAQVLPQSNTIEIPKGTEIGSYYILLMTDFRNYISESNESNNVASVALEIVMPQIDLSVEKYYYNNTIDVNPGSYLSIENYLYNKGKDYVNSTVTGYYLSSDTIFDNPGDVYLSESYGSSLYGNSNTYQYGSATIPMNTKGGTYYLLHVADHKNNIDELNEKNNVYARKVNVIKPDIDHVITNEALSLSKLTVCNSITAYNFLENRGNTNPSYNTTGYYLSTDTVFNLSSDLYLNSVTSYDYYNTLQSSSITIPESTIP